VERNSFRFFRESEIIPFQSVDDYLESCEGRGESPEKPDSGQFVVRIDSQLHRVMSHAAEERGPCLNSLIEDRLKESFSLAASGGIAPDRAPHEILALTAAPV
jgi:hypothetical protein